MVIRGGTADILLYGNIARRFDTTVDNCTICVYSAWDEAEFMLHLSYISGYHMRPQMHLIIHTM